MLAPNPAICHGANKQLIFLVNYWIVSIKKTKKSYFFNGMYVLCPDPELKQHQIRILHKNYYLKVFGNEDNTQYVNNIVLLGHKDSLCTTRFKYLFV